MKNQSTIVNQRIEIIREALRQHGALAIAEVPGPKGGTLEFWNVRGEVCILQVFPDDHGYDLYHPVTRCNDQSAVLEAINRLGIAVADTSLIGLDLRFNLIAGVHVADRDLFERLQSELEACSTGQNNFSVLTDDFERFLEELAASDLPEDKTTLTQLRPLLTHCAGVTEEVNFYTS